MLKTVIDNPWVRAAGLLIVIVLVVCLAYMLSQVLVPLFLAFTVAYAFDPVMKYFECKRISRTAAVVGLVAILTITVLMIPLYFVPKMVAEAQDLIDSASREVDDTWLNKILDRLPLEILIDLLPPPVESSANDIDVNFQDALVDLSSVESDEKTAVDLHGTDEETAIALQVSDEETAIALHGTEEEIADDIDLRAVLAKRIGFYIQANSMQFFRAHASSLMGVSHKAGSSFADLFTTFGNFVMNFILVIGNFALFAFVAIYLLKDYDTIIKNIDDLIPLRYKDKIRTVMGKIDHQLRGFLRGQLLVCIFLGVFYTIGLELSGTPFGLFLGIFGGIASMVPYLGFVLTIGPAVILNLIEHGFALNVVGVLLTFGIAQTIESYYVTPKVVGSQVGLGPVWIVLSFVVFSSTLGFIGLLLAIPIAAVLKVLVMEMLQYYKESSFFLSSSPPSSGKDGASAP